MTKFKNAVPVFLKGKEKEKNYQAGFICDINALKGEKAYLKITAASLYKIYLNGSFLGYGPARAGHGYVRFDEFDFNLEKGKNQIFIEVAGYNTKSFYTIKHDSFLMCEINTESGEEYFTGRDFKGVDLSKVRRQKVTKYSYQRTFSEVYSMDKNIWEYTDEAEIREVDLEDGILPRVVPKPLYKIYDEVSEHDEGKYSKTEGFADYKKRFLLNYDECEDRLADELYITRQSCKITKTSSGTYKEYVFGKNNVGFINVIISAKEDSEIYLYFSEILEDGKIDCGIHKSETIDIVKYELKKSNKKYCLETFEAYGLKYLGVLVKKGNVEIEKVFLREYSYPLYENTKFKTNDKELNLIFETAKHTFRTNLLDIYMDCPTRERAGWLCDSFFEGKSEPYFAGNSLCERVFLENFSISKGFRVKTEGMLPMCYPSDTCDFIPQWNLWYILEVYEYLKRDIKDKAFFKQRIEGILKYFEENENELGLYEVKDTWMFVEWSAANKYMEGVNFPTNMLYYKALKAAAEILEKSELFKKAEQIKKVIKEQSYNGDFFVDNAVKKDGKYIRTNNVTEVCQYYALYFEIADEKDYPRLKDKVLNFFGPEREKKWLNPEIEYATPFMGYLIRLMLLLRWGEYGKILENIKEYYLYMAEKTETFWEHKLCDKSCNHGINSYIGAVMTETLCGIKNINYIEKTVEFDEEFAKGVEYNIEIGLGDGILKVTSDGKTRVVKNKSKYKIIKKRKDYESDKNLWGHNKKYALGRKI